MALSTRRKVGYFYDTDVGNFYYAQGHPMKPHRMRMTHNLLVAYGLFDRMDVLITPRANDREMTRFHSDEYISFLKAVTPETLGDQLNTLCRFNVLEDCPVFDGLWEYCQIAAGGSLAGAARLNSGESSVCINWAGGLHHAKKAEASGFCYINDCVLAILELLKQHPRVLYVDIDIHHGDGVEEAFYTTDRVMTASFHKFGDYFPGTGDAGDIGIGRGKHYSANFPLRDGIDDESYREIFVPVMSRIMEWYRPGAVVLQCGADSLTGDRLGCFNLSLFGHAQCVDFFKRYDVPLLLLGGGGYTVRNVARCWAYETSRVVGATLSDELPDNDNYEFYGPDFRLHITPSNMENHNSTADLERTKMKIFENLRHLPFAPGTPFMDTPRVSPLGVHKRGDDSDNEDPDVRHKRRRAKPVVDYAGSDDEDDDQYISSLPHSRRRRNRLNFPRRPFPSTELSIKYIDKNGSIPGASRDDYSPRHRSEVTAERSRPQLLFGSRTETGGPGRMHMSQIEAGSVNDSRVVASTVEDPMERKAEDGVHARRAEGQEKERRNGLEPHVGESGADGEASRDDTRGKEPKTVGTGEDVKRSIAGGNVDAMNIDSKAEAKDEGGGSSKKRSSAAGETAGEGGAELGRGAGKSDEVGKDGVMRTHNDGEYAAKRAAEDEDDNASALDASEEPHKDSGEDRENDSHQGGDGKKQAEKASDILREDRRRVADSEAGNAKDVEQKSGEVEANGRGRAQGDGTEGAEKNAELANGNATTEGKGTGDRAEAAEAAEAVEVGRGNEQGDGGTCGEERISKENGEGGRSAVAEGREELRKM